MLIESGRVVAVEADCLWVEAVQKSVCGSCSAKQGCGQSLLARWGIHPSYLRVLRTEKNRDTAFAPGDQVDIGIPETVVVKGSLLAYMVPLAGFMAGAAVGQLQFASEPLAILLALLGLLLGALVVRYVAHRSRNNRAYQPVLLGLSRASAELVSPVNVIKSDNQGSMGPGA